MKASLIIAAGGSGSRFKKSLSHSAELSRANSAKLPSKLFYPLAGITLLERTIERFQNIPAVAETILAIPSESENEVRSMIKRRAWKNVKTVRGGATRAESVYNALVKMNPENALVAVHDGARPFVSEETLEKLFAEAQKNEAVLLGQKVVPTIKEVNSKGEVVRTVDRSILCEAETPQVTRRQLLLQAYRKTPRALEYTDEASLLEAIGVKVKVVTHEGWNPKITTFKDFELAEAVLNQVGQTRTGFGRDTHRLVEKRKMILGGIQIPFEKGPLGHSDGDALLHALTDALLGAAGAGDIGDWYSDKDPKNKNISSEKILRRVLDEAIEPRFNVVNADTVIVLERPKLGTYKEKMQKNIARILNLPVTSVCIKAKTAEGLGPEGQGLSVTCEALVTLKEKIK